MGKLDLKLATGVLLIPPNIRVDGGWLDAGTVPYQCIEKINSFPYPWSYELRKKKDIHITDMMIGNTPIPSIANVPLHQEVLFGQFILGSVCRHALLIAPIAR